MNPNPDPQLKILSRSESVSVLIFQAESGFVSKNAYLKHYDRNDADPDPQYSKEESSRSPGRLPTTERVHEPRWAHIRPEKKQIQ
jgi:hypothetical protein